MRVFYFFVFYSLCAVALPSQDLSADKDLDLLMGGGMEYQAFILRKLQLESRQEECASAGKTSNYVLALLSCLQSPFIDSVDRFQHESKLRAAIDREKRIPILRSALEHSLGREHEWRSLLERRVLELEYLSRRDAL